MFLRNTNAAAIFATQPVIIISVIFALWRQLRYTDKAQSLHNPAEQSPSGKFIDLHLFKDFSAFYGTQWFTAVLTNSQALIPILSHLNPLHTHKSCTAGQKFANP